MQTFLPYPDFERSAQVLDRQRLGKQRSENLQIANAIVNSAYGWQNHPAVSMWRGYLPILYIYHHNICSEWVRRGYRDEGSIGKFLDIAELDDSWTNDNPRFFDNPKWLGDPDFHRSHRSNLLRKDWDHYSDIFERDLPMDLPYIWPEP